MAYKKNKSKKKINNDYSSVYIQCILVVFSNKPDEDWYWPVEILYTSAFFTLFDQSMQ